VPQVIVSFPIKYDTDNVNVKQFSIVQLPLQAKDELTFKSLAFKPFELGAITGSMRKGKNYVWIPHIVNTGAITGLRLSEKGEMMTDHLIRYEQDPKNQNTIPKAAISDIYEDSHDQLWLATIGMGLHKIDLTKPYGAVGSVTHYQHKAGDNTTISDNSVWSILPGDDESLFIVTDITVDRFKNNRFEPVFKNMATPQSIFKASNGYIYITTSVGLYHLEPKDDKYDIKKDSLVGNYEALLINGDDLGRIWISNGNELVCYDPNAQSVIRFDSRDGLEFNKIGIFKSNTGRLVTLGMKKGISIFDPAKLKISKNKIIPVLTNIMINNKPALVGNGSSDETKFYVPKHISMLDKLVIDYLHNNFSIEFAALEFTSPERNRYRHKLEGYDEGWIESDYKNRIATYTNLPFGEYTFRVKASNHHGLWSGNESSLKIIVLPPPWRTWWAYTGYGLTVAGLLVWARRNIVQRERLKASLQLEQVEREKEHFELEKAKEVDKLKTSFFTNISHEFRTPLTLIKGPVQTLLEEFADNAKVQERLKLVHRNSDLLLKLINQLMDLAKLESGTMKIEKSKGNINTFINAIASSFQSFAGQKQISIHIEVPSTSYEAIFDKDKLETILINLINNAIKFTPAGGSVTVQAEVSQPPVTSHQQLILKVKDTGIGIPPEHQSKIFERFHQVSEANKEVGTGIGLSLVKELVALMEGNISVKSAEGIGSEFTIELPIELLPEHEVTPLFTGNQYSVISSELPPPITDHRLPITDHQLPITPQESEIQSKPQVLVVEDNHDLRAFIIDCLGDEFNFLQAENGKIGLTLATEEIPDMIISDVMMPEMDGITMAEKIKNDIRTSHIPLILLTAKSSEDAKLQGLQSGADDYLTKPFNKHELLLKVRNGVSRQLKLRERLRAELMSTVPKAEVPSADEQFLNKVKEGILARLSDEQLSVESLAEDMSMSRVQLYRKITALTGLSANELIRKLRLQKAAQLLQQKWGPVSQVAYEVGFSNLSYFSKVFKEEFGVLPSEYSLQS
jgi:signal transduction histidine kinase/DNA-binding response OmpR family regulator